MIMANNGSVLSEQGAFFGDAARISDLPDYGLNLNLDEIPEVTAQEIFNFIDKAPYGDMLYISCTFEEAKNGPHIIMSIPWIDCESCWVSNNYERSKKIFSRNVR